MKKTIELLAPGGDPDSIKAAIAAGANAVYCGINKFNARNRATNISTDELNGILRLAHTNNCEVFLTLNILIFDKEIPDLIRLLNKLVNTSINGIIVQDIGLLYILSSLYPSLKTHASTQLTTHNIGQIKFLKKLNISRLNLSRELNLNEIIPLCSTAKENNILTEVFIHGSYCISFSGLCFMSFVQNGNSGNRGRCSQPCRNLYITSHSEKKYALNLKDNAAFPNIKELYEAGVNSMKIEGRIKKYHYVYAVVSAYRQQLDRLYNNRNLLKYDNKLLKSFNRSFSNGFLTGRIGKEMFVDNPRDQSKTSREEFEANKVQTKQIIDELSIEKEELKVAVSGKAEDVLIIKVCSANSVYAFSSDKLLSRKGNCPLTENEISKRLKTVNETEYYIKSIDFNRLENGLFIPFSELNKLKNEILLHLRNSKKYIPAVKPPPLKGNRLEPEHIKSSLLISSITEIDSVINSNLPVFFQLPDSLPEENTALQKTFISNKNIIPWFPAILIAEDFMKAVRFLKNIQAKQIITDNSGIAYEAYQLGIPWIAGPRMNLSNSYSLLCLKDCFNCTGAFLSPELSEKQIKNIVVPENFQIYTNHEISLELMVSRQCFFLGTSDCHKQEMDDNCMSCCSKTAYIEDLKQNKYRIEKKAGCFNRIYKVPPST